MTLLGVSRGKDTNEDIGSSESLATSDNIWREVEFESDADHKEMTRTYGCDDYLSRWLPNIRRESDEPGLLRKEKIEKRPEKEQPTRLFKSPCHHHVGRKSTMNDKKIQHDAARKTYFEAIKCSPMKLRQSLATFKRPKLDDNFTLKPTHETLVNPKTQDTPGATEQTTDLSISLESMETLTEKPLALESITQKPKTSLGIVEMRNDEMGQLGSLCFHKENHYGDSMYTPCNMVGGKLRRIQRETGNGLLTGRNKHKELLVRCESIMIYPKVLINHKQQTDKYKLPETPKEAWQDSSQPALPPSSENFTRLPQLATTEQTTQKVNDKISSAEVQQDTSKDQATSRTTQNSATTKIIIPFGENEFRKSAEKSSKISPSPPREVVTTKTVPKEEGAMTGGGSQKEEVGGASMKMTGKSKEHLGEGRIPRKPRYLKESSKLNEQVHTTRRHSGIVLGNTQLEVTRNLSVATQYLTMTTPNSPLKRFRIPTGVETIHVGRENYSPKRTVPYRFHYSQKGITEYTKGYEEVSVKQGDCEENGGHRENSSLVIGGKGLLKASLLREEQATERLVEDENKKRVQFVLQKSRYFAQ